MSYETKNNIILSQHFGCMLVTGREEVGEWWGWWVAASSRSRAIHSQKLLVAFRRKFRKYHDIFCLSWISCKDTTTTTNREHVWWKQKAKIYAIQRFDTHAFCSIQCLDTIRRLVRRWWNRRRRRQTLKNKTTFLVVNIHIHIHMNTHRSS